MAFSELRRRAEDTVRQLRADRAFRRRKRPRARADPSAPRHVVCIVVDALRADAIDPDRTPFLASLDPTPAVTASPWTFPAVSSLFSGQYPHRHGAMRETDAFASSVADMTPLPDPVPLDRPLLSDRFAAAGYATFGGFGMIVPFLALRGRFGKHALLQDGSAEEVFAEHEAWLRGQDGPTFSYLHLADAHEPVDPPEPYWRSHDVDPEIPGIRTWRFEDVVHPSPTVERYRRHRRRLYEAVVEYLDHRLGAYRARLRHLLGEDVLVVVTSDHGEAFWEQSAFAARVFADPRPAYGVGHGGVPFEAVTRVPLAIDAPGPALGGHEGEGARASLVDVAPTLLGLAGLEAPEEIDGRSLAGSPPDSRRLIVEGTRYGHEKKAVYGRGRKLVVSPADQAVFATSVDDGVPAAEAIEVAGPEVHRELADAFPPWPDGSGTSAPSRRVRRRLEHLGYM